MRALAFPLGFLVASRLALFLYSAIAYRLVPTLEGTGTWNAFSQKAWLNAWTRWDAGWYVSIAERGYFFTPDGQSNVAFFPLFPLLILAATFLGLNSFVAGWLIANLAFLGAGLLFWRLTEATAGGQAAHRGLLWLTVFPYAFFYGAVYAESLFLLGAVGAFWAAERGRFGLATVLGAMAALTRPVGIVLLPALVAFRLRTSRSPRDLLVFLAIPLAPALFLGYLWWAFGTPLAFFASHSRGWNVAPGFYLVVSTAKAVAVALAGFKFENPDNLAALLEFGLQIVLLALVWPIWRRLGSPYGIYTILCLAIAEIFAQNALGRQLAVVFPAFMLAGVLDRGGVAGDGLKLLSFTIQLLLLALFATWRWVS